MRTSNQVESEKRSSTCQPLRLVGDKPTHQTQDMFAGQTSKQVQRIRADIERVARRPFNILITGETGTGKTQIARQIHRLSARARNPLIELNCANLPEHLVEAELFGHRKGAFTGADHDRRGLFEEADGGILFLDEIGDIPLALQNRLLKAIDEKQIKRLGTNHYQFCDVQIIAATSRNLPTMIHNGDFREDLYCRLAVLTLETPPLRERREDIPALIAGFLRQAVDAVKDSSAQQKVYEIKEDALALLCDVDYPGNIRALRNFIYELTSYVNEQEPISIELVQFALSKLSYRTCNHANSIVYDPNGEVTSPDFGSPAAIDIKKPDTSAAYSFLHSIADEGDIVLPPEVCVLRSGETFKQWTERAKRCSIEATRRATGGTMRSAAVRLGLTRESVKGYLRRTKRAESDVLFDWRREVQ
jgi:transcriptional regulator with GAF, ATPase, and Fis domain